jgi:hypothetical protein
MLAQNFDIEIIFLDSNLIKVSIIRTEPKSREQIGKNKFCNKIDSERVFGLIPTLIRKIEEVIETNIRNLVLILSLIK